MRRFLALILTQCIIFYTLTGIAILVGRQQPLPERVASWHLTDCAPPCWIGIVPGVTTLQEAKAKISKIFGSASNQIVFQDSIGFEQDINIFVGPKSRSLSITIFFSPDSRQIVKTIQLNENLPTVGEIYPLLGPPVGLLLPEAAGEYSVVLIQSHQHYSTAFSIGVHMNDMNFVIPLDAPIGRLIFDSEPYTSPHTCEATSSEPAGRIQAWRGFVRLGDYYSHLVNC